MSAQEAALSPAKLEPAKVAQVQEHEQKQEQQQPQNAQSESLNSDVLAQINRIVTLFSKSSGKISLSPPPGQFVIGCVLQLLALGLAVVFGIYAVKSVRLASEANLYASQALEEARLANEFAVLSLCAALQQQDGILPAICNRRPLVDPSDVPLDVSQLFSQTETASASTTSTSGSFSPGTTTFSNQPGSTRNPIFSFSFIPPSSSNPTGTIPPSFASSTGSSSPTTGSSGGSSSGSPSGSSSGSSGAPLGAIIGGTIGGLIVLLLGLVCLLGYRRRKRRSNLDFSAPQAMPIYHAPSTVSDKSNGLSKRKKAYQFFRDTFIESKISTGRE